MKDASGGPAWTDTATIPIDNVSDTARWVAYYRAMESERPDALFRDPFARRLAGAQGKTIVTRLPQGRSIAPALIVRTAVFDEMIMERIRGGADVILNLAAGLDARPWRLPLPSDLQWFDVDLPGMIDYKSGVLKDERPACRYRAIAADVTNPQQRETVFAQAAAAGREVLVITEGLLIYLESATVMDLAQALHRHASFRWWLTDLVSPQLMRRLQRSHGNALRNAPFRFAPAEGTAFFAALGWREAAYRSFIIESRRLGRQMRGAWLWSIMFHLMPPSRKAAFLRMSGTVLMERTSEV